jgi:hypothetical protein
MRKLATLLLIIVFALLSAPGFAQSNNVATEKVFVDSLSSFILKTTERLPDIPGSRLS